MNTKKTLAAVCAGAFLMCNAALATPDAIEAASESAHPGMMAPEPHGPAAVQPQGMVMLEIPGQEQGTTEIILVPVELLAMLIMQAEAEAAQQAQPGQQIVAPPLQTVGVEI
jgi:hypothetical protein